MKANKIRIRLTFLAVAVAILVLVTFFYSDGPPPSYNPERNYKSIEKALMTQIILAEDSSVIELDEGHFIFKNSLILDGKKHITIRGKGIDKTVLSFKLQDVGAEGLKITNCSNIVLEDFTIEDAAGDNIKVTDTKGITFRRVKAAWTGEVSEENGAYAIYPVICEDVLIEECVVLGASDAGIYVGQSENVVIRNNEVYWNVAGIESENSENVEIYGNEAYENTGGILVFDLPGLTRFGQHIKVYDNKVHDNNLFNFAPAGNIVGTVPPGTGVMVLATRDVEIYENTIEDNNSIGVAIVSYDLVEAMKGKKTKKEGKKSSAQKFSNRRKKDPGYNPFPRSIYVHDNTYSGLSILPDLGNDFGKLFLWKFGLDRPLIIWDGIESDEYLLADGGVNPEYKICVQEEGAKTAILDAANDFEGLAANPESLNCKL